MSDNRNILLIDNRDSFTYNLVQVFEELGCFVKILPQGETWFDLIFKFDRIVFSPGPGLPNDFPIMFDILKKAPKHVSILGICLGHQAIAQFYGAKLFKQDLVKHGQKKSIYNVCKNPKSALYSMPAQFKAGLYHSWAVDIQSLPDELTVSCYSEDNVVMGICHQSLSIEGIQFHPESFLTETGSELLKNWLTL